MTRDLGALATNDRRGRIVLPDGWMIDEWVDPSDPNVTVIATRKTDQLARLFGGKDRRRWTDADARRYDAADRLQIDCATAAGARLDGRQVVRGSGGHHGPPSAVLDAQSRVRQAKASIPASCVNAVWWIAVGNVPLVKAAGYMHVGHQTARARLMDGLDALVGFYGV